MQKLDACEKKGKWNDLNELGKVWLFVIRGKIVKEK